MVEAFFDLNGSGPQRGWIRNVLLSQNQANNTSTFQVQLVYNSGNYGSWSNTDQYWSVQVSTPGTARYFEGSFRINSPGTGEIVLLDTTYTKTNDANGNLAAFNITGTIATDHTAIGSGSGTITQPASPRIPKEPNQVTGVTITNPTTTGFRIAWTAPNNNGASISRYDIQYSTSSSFSGATTVTDTASPYDLTGRTPGTKYYVRVRAVNSVGAGPWSATASGTTLPSVPPGLKVAPNVSGTQATLTFSPPGGVTGVTSYRWERRVTGTTSPVATGNSSTITAVVTGLTPGTSYDWRASAFIGSYQSPWSTWLTQRQPNPNTSPGDYFDGSTVAGPDSDVTYAWLGAVNNSQSTATGLMPTGWEAQFVGGAGTLHRSTSGEFAIYAARVTITRDTTGAGSRFGQQAAAGFMSPVTADATYVGSIHVYLSRGQRLAAEVTWLNSAGGVISRSVGGEVEVPSGDWFRLAAGDVAPALAVWAIVKVIDVSGVGWSTWKGGDFIDLDGAMISLNQEFPYFDGSFLPDGTYRYAWTGTANASTSTRTPVNPGSVSTFSETPEEQLGADLFSIVDPDCNPVVPPPRPPTVPSDCVDDTGIWRRVYITIPSDFVSDWLEVVPTMELHSTTVAARQVRIRYYPNPNGLAPSQINTSTWCAEQIVSYMPAKTVMTIDGVTQRTWAEVNGGNAQNADHLLYGTGGTPPSWPILSCGIAYVVSLEVPVDSPNGNITGEIFVTTRT